MKSKNTTNNLSRVFVRSPALIRKVTDNYEKIRKHGIAVTLNEQVGYLCLSSKLPWHKEILKEMGIVGDL